jgi:hypothetical protein
MARSFLPDHVAAALGLAPVQPVGLGQIIPGFSSLVSSAQFIKYRYRCTRHFIFDKILIQHKALKYLKFVCLEL